MTSTFDILHWRYALSETPEDGARISDRFVIVGEGRSDHISGYIDGFGISQNLARSNVNRLSTAMRNSAGGRSSYRWQYGR